MRTLVVLSASLLAAGCLGSAAPAEIETANAPATGTADGPASAPAADPTARDVVDWTGHMRVGAAYEVPNHVAETQPATGPLWSTSFHYEVQEAPQDMEIELDWTAAAGEVMFMVILPDDGAGETTLETDLAERGPLCAKIPADRLLPGTYAIMAHAQAAADVHLHFQVSTLGGEGRLVDEPHTAPAATVATYFAGAAGGDGDGSVAPEPCAEA